MKIMKRIVAMALCLVLCMGILVDVQAATLRITKQPKSVEAMVGEKASFTVTAQGDGLKYQWFYKDPDMSSYKSVKNATSKKYSITMKQSLDGRQFYCQVTDKNKKKVKSNKVTLTWDSTLAILTHPADVTVKSGAEAKVSVKANGKDLRYTWWVKAPGADAFTQSDVTSSSYAVTMSEAIDGTEVFCTVFDATGTNVSSEHATLKLYRPIDITRQPKSVSAMKGETAKVYLKATGSKLTYLWYQKAPGEEKFVKTSVKSSSYSVTMTPELDGTQLRCLIKDNKGNSITSAVATLSWNSTLKIQTQPKDVTAEEGKTAKVSVSVNGKGLTYQWFAKNKDEADFTLTNVTSSSYSVKMAEEVDGRQVYCIVTDETGASETSATVTMKMKRYIIITTQPKNVSVMKGETAKVYLKATGNKLTYLWYQKAPGEEKFTKTTVKKSSYSVTMTPELDGTQLRCLIKDSQGHSTYSQTVTLTWDSTLKIQTQPKDVTVEEGKTAKVSMSVNGKGLTYQWFAKNKDEADFTLTNVTSSAYSVKMAEEVDGRQVYCVVTDETGASETSATVILTMKRYIIITTQPKDVSVMKGETAKVYLKATGSKLTYLWYQKAPGEEKFTKTAVKKSSYSVTMAPELDGTQLRCLIKDDKGHSTYSQTVTLSWDATLQILTQPKNVTVEDTKTAKVSVSVNGKGLTYQWFAKNKDEADFILTDVTSSSYSVKMAEEVDGRQVYCVITDETGATVTSETVTLTLKRYITITKHPVDMYVFKDKTAKVSVEATGNNLRYVWYVKAPGASKYTKSNVTTNYYSVKMTSKVDGTKVYCLITEASKKTMKTTPVTLGMVTAGIKYTTADNVVTITGYSGSSKSLTIPSSISGKPVVAVAPEAFADSAVTKLTLPDSILTIGEKAFAGSALTTLRIPKQITAIPEGAFYGCASLTSVTLPDAVTIIGKQAFANCTKLEEMTTY